MSNISIFNPSANLPAYMKRGAVSDAAKALAGGGGSFGKRISVKGGVFRLIADGKEVTSIEERYLDVVIVNTAPKVSRMFYMKEFSADAPAAPDCWSQDGDRPERTVSEGAQSATCATCLQNVKGSGKGDSRACRYQQRLAVVLANDVEGDVMQLALAATSLFGKAEGDNRPLQEYARWLIAQGADPTKLVTRMKFDTNVQMPKLFFKPMRWLTDDEESICVEQGQSPDAIQAITLTVSAMDGVASTVSAPRAETVTPKAPPAPVVDDEPPAPPPKRTRAAKAAPVQAPAEEDDEPVVRAAPPKPAAVVPTQSGLAKTLADWDDE